MIPEVSGVFCAAATPIQADLSPDLPAFTAHCRWLLAQGCDGVALLGTTGEANSFSSSERKAVLEAALGAGIAAGQLMPGTGVANIPDTVDLTRHALSQGVSRVVMLPPFYYKGVSDEGLFAAYARIIDGIGDTRLRVILYHIPQVSGVALSHDLIDRLRTAFPEVVVGIKDSFGQFENMAAMTARFPGFSVLAGADPLLLPLLQKGGAGCITATANIIGRDLAVVFRGANNPAQADAVAAAQARIVGFRSLSNAYVQLPAIKAMVALMTGDDGWCRLRPPLMALTTVEMAELREKMIGLGAVVRL